MLGIGQQEKSSNYSLVNDFNILVKMWFADGSFLSRNKKLIEKQMIKIFYQTSDLNELYSMRMRLSKGSKLVYIINHLIKFQTLEQIAMMTLPVEVYRLMVNFISMGIGSHSDRNIIYLASKKRLRELEQTTPITEKEHFDILFLINNLNKFQKIEYGFTQ